MKTITTWGILLAITAGVCTRVFAAEPAPGAPDKIGVYDSRAVAYAHFWSPAASEARNAAVAAARAAKAAGDTAAFEAGSKAMEALQKRMHEQVFSSAPATEAMAAIAPRLPALQRELGVARFVSKWDTKALKKVPEASRVDVTDSLVRAFITPTEKQQKVLDSMKTKEPISLLRMKVLNFVGGA
jgi:hypothetical protein